MDENVRESRHTRKDMLCWITAIRGVNEFVFRLIELLIGRMLEKENVEMVEAIARNEGVNTYE